MQTNPIKRAVEIVGGNARLAAKLHVSAGMVSQWLTGNRPVAAHHCIPIEMETHGAVTRYELRPDVFGSATEAA